MVSQDSGRASFGGDAAWEDGDRRLNEGGAVRGDAACSRWCIWHSPGMLEGVRHSASPVGLTQSASDSKMTGHDDLVVYG